MSLAEESRLLHNLVYTECVLSDSLSGSDVF